MRNRVRITPSVLPSRDTQPPNPNHLQVSFFTLTLTIARSRDPRLRLLGPGYCLPTLAPPAVTARHGAHARAAWGPEEDFARSVFSESSDYEDSDD